VTLRSDVTVALGDGRRAVELLEAICALYDAVFSQPPFRWTDEESAHHRQSLVGLARNPTFSLVTAQTGEVLVGFAYGVRLRPDTSWWANTLEALPDELITEWEGRTFAVIDLAVRQDYRKRGLGRELLAMLLGGRSEERVTLAVQPVAMDTKAFYAHLGWELVGTAKAPPAAVSPLFDLYVLTLQPTP